jgi:hypothetical protein
MSFIERAKRAAAEAAEQTRQAVTETAARADTVIHDPATSAKARLALGRAKRGVATVIDRIDPGVLADVIIKATALQERANEALRAKGSPYRINEIGIGAAIPPSVTFTIARIEIYGEGAMQPIDSVELVKTAAVDSGTIQALDGTTLDEAGLVDEAEAEGASG